MEQAVFVVFVLCVITVYPTNRQQQLTFLFMFFIHTSDSLFTANTGQHTLVPTNVWCRDYRAINSD